MKHQQIVSETLTGLIRFDTVVGLDLFFKVAMRARFFNYEDQANHCKSQIRSCQETIELKEVDLQLILVDG